MKRSSALITATTLAVALLLGAGSARAQFTETLPKHTWMLELSHNHTWLSSGYDNNGRKTELLERMERYDPGGGLQGIIIPKATAEYDVTVLQLRYGILDYLTVVLGIPIVARTKVIPDMQWVEGDYQWPLGRSFSEDDFWQWAASMGQPKPGRWEGNKGVLSDIVLGGRYRFSDHIPQLKKLGVGIALTAFYALPTGAKKDPEQLTSSGATSWELHFQGDLGFHLGVDKTFLSIDKRITLGVEVFYEVMLPHKYDTPRGTVNPLLLNFAPYAGDTYRIDPGDFMGASLAATFVLWKGPAKATWLTKGSVAKAAKLPPILTFSFQYTFTYLGQSDWTSDSDLWDWTNEKVWRPGYKNTLTFQLMVSLLRVGVPAQVFFRYRSLSLIPGKNCRSVDGIAAGVRIPLKFW
jgi:hypothetical protein